MVRRLCFDGAARYVTRCVIQTVSHVHGSRSASTATDALCGGQYHIKVVKGGSFKARWTECAVSGSDRQPHVPYVCAGDGLSEKPVLSPDASPEEMGDPGKAAYVRPPSHVGFEYVGDGDVKTAANFTEETDTGTGFRHTVNR